MVTNDAGRSDADVEPVLSIKNLVTEFVTEEGTSRAVDEVSYSAFPSEVLGIVGESGSGKSVSVLSALRLITQPPGYIRQGQVLFEGKDLLSLPQSELRRIRGAEISMIFQDPMTSLNPVVKVGLQVAEAVLAHNRISKGAAKRRVIQLLEIVGIAEPEKRFNQYPHEFSGGMRQRAMIAMAMANEPKVIIADEPTTALDVTIQAQVLRALDRARQETGAAVILITHNLGLIAEIADRVIVMYAGRVLETGSVFTIFNEPRHPYTVALMASLPKLDDDVDRLSTIPGQPPSPLDPPPGCKFHPRCALSLGRDICRQEEPTLIQIGNSSHRSACHFSMEVTEEYRSVERTHR